MKNTASSAFENGKTFIHQVDEYIGTYLMDPLGRRAGSTAFSEQVAELMPHTADEAREFLNGMAAAGRETGRYFPHETLQLRSAIDLCNEIPDILPEDLNDKLKDLPAHVAANYVEGLTIAFEMGEANRALYDIFVYRSGEESKLDRWSPADRERLVQLRGALVRAAKEEPEWAIPGDLPESRAGAQLVRATGGSADANAPSPQSRPAPETIHELVQPMWVRSTDKDMAQGLQFMKVAGIVGFTDEERWEAIHWAASKDADSVAANARKETVSDRIVTMICEPIRLLNERQWGVVRRAIGDRWGG